MDDQVFEGGVEGYEMRKSFNCGARNTFNIIYIMGLNLKNHDEPGFKRAQSVFYTHCLNRKHKYLKYSLNLVWWNVIDRYRLKQLKQEDVLGSFEYKP